MFCWQRVDSGSILLETESTETVVALLRYIYAADVLVDAQIAVDVRDLAIRFHNAHLTVSIN